MAGEPPGESSCMSCASSSLVWVDRRVKSFLSVDFIACRQKRRRAEGAGEQPAGGRRVPVGTLVCEAGSAF